MVPDSRAVTVQIGRTPSSIRTSMWAGALLGPARYVIGRPPCHEEGASGPRMAPRITRASRHESGALMMAGSEIASAGAIRFAPGTDAHPGVSGSPGTRKS